MGPTYPVLLAGVFKLLGIYSKASAYVILSLNCLFAALTCFPLRSIARTAFGDRTSIPVAWGWAFFPYSLISPPIWSGAQRSTLSCLRLPSPQLSRSSASAARLAGLRPSNTPAAACLIAPEQSGSPLEQLEKFGELDSRRSDDVRPDDRPEVDLQIGHAGIPARQRTKHSRRRPPAK